MIGTTCSRVDLNHRLLSYQDSTLTAELREHVATSYDVAVKLLPNGSSSVNDCIFRCEAVAVETG